MTLSSTAAHAQQQDFYDLCKLKELSAQRSSQHSTSLIAKIAAAGLVLASSGFGGVYAWQAGAHGAVIIGGVPALACLAVVMALSLELAKPYAIANCLASFRNWQPVKGAMLAALGLIAVVYSLTAEISLLAMQRSDNAAQRQSAINASVDQAAAAKRMSERYEAARIELAALPSSRAAGELQASIDGLLLEPGTNGCVSIDGPVSKRVCPEVVDLRAELARAHQREQLTSEMASTVTSPTASAPAETFADADPGAAALATYLAALGFVMQPGVVAQWLVLVPVLALEIGSALAGILAGVSGGEDMPGRAPHPALLQARMTPSVSVCGEEAPNLAAEGRLHTGTTNPCTPAKARVGRPESPEARVSLHSCEIVPLAPVRGTSRDEAARRIMATLRARGGKIDASLRTLASDLAVSVGTLRGAIAALVSAGEIISRPTTSGTVIRLAA